MQKSFFRIGGFLLALVLFVFVAGCENRDDDALTGGAPVADTQDTPWNLVVITMDTTRTDSLGAYGQRLDVTPNLDRLAEEGVLFEHVAGPGSTTLPSHSTLFTGKFPYEHGARSNFGYVLAESNLTLAEVLAEEGYRTSAEISATVLAANSQISQGYQSVRDPHSPGVQLRSVDPRIGMIEKYPIRVGNDISRRGIDFIRQNQKRPFHLWLHYFEPHLPPPLANEFRARFPGEDYLAEVAAMDAAIGSVLDEIRRLGLRQRTLVVVTADHGEGNGDHGERTHGAFLYQSTVHVPWILWGPSELPENRRIGGLVRSADIAPTLLDLMDIPPLPDVQGVSLKGAVLGTERDPQLVAYGESLELSQAFEVVPLRYLRAGRWKYVHKVVPELFDLDADPGEESNLASAHPEIVERMQVRLRKLLESSSGRGADSRTDVDDRMRAELAALGYITPSSSLELTDELGSLELRGADAAEKQADAEDMTIAQEKMRVKDYVGAVQLLEPLLERNPDSLTIQGMLALSYGAAGRTSEAKRMLRSVLKADPCSDESRTTLTRVLKAQKRYEESISLLAEGPSECRGYRQHQTMLAYQLATVPDDRVRDGERALETIRDVISTLEGEPGSGYLDALAVAQAEVGQFREAIKTANAALRRARAEQAAPAVVAVYHEHLQHFEVKEPVRDP